MASRDDETLRGLLVAACLAIAGSLLAGAYFMAFPRAPQVPAAPAGPSVPAFSLERLQGGTVSLESLRGKIVVIDFWATWCPPCRAEMPWLVKMGKRFESQGVAFVAISEDDPPGQVPLVTEFSREVPGLEHFAVLGNPEIETQYGVESLPTLFIVDRQGHLVQRLTGAADEASVVALVERLAGQD